MDVDRYLRAHREALRKVCLKLEQMLSSANISYIAPDAGLFIIVNLQDYLPLHPTFTDEVDLYFYLLDQAHVNITPGQSMGSQIPGIFRICFAYNTPSVTVSAVRRMLKALKDRKQSRSTKI